MTDQEVVELYRCLLGRAPENADTIKAFQHYYPDFARGRQAVFRSEEFEIFLAEVTGRKPFRDVAASLALAFLERAGSAALPLPAAAPADDAIRSGMRLMLQRLAAPLLAVVVGEPAGMTLDDLVPAGADAAILHIAPGYPPAIPLVSRLADGAALYRMAIDPAGLAALLESQTLRVAVLYLAGRPADASWIDALRGHFADHALVVCGPDAAGFDSATLSRIVAQRHPGEPALAWSGVHVHCFGGWHLPVVYEPPAIQPAPLVKTGLPRLALAAIVRDEAACIVNMLRSVLPAVSFVALLDTGSTDDTQALAREILVASGAPHAIRTEPHDRFDDRFADMRNAALDMVPPDIDWVLMLDADEEMVPEDFPALFELIAPTSATPASTTQHAATQREVDAYALPRYNYQGANKSGEVMLYPDRQIRLLRNTPDRRVRYSGAVHETVRDVPTGNPPLDASALGEGRFGPHIHHLVRRFRNAEQEDRKQQFYRDIAARHQT